MSKSPDAFRTISEVAEWLGVQAHVLRFWESKFTQVKPVKRAGGRRYYRPADMLLLGGIRKLLHDDGMSIKDVQAILRDLGISHVSEMSHSLDAAAPGEPSVSGEGDQQTGWSGDTPPETAPQVSSEAAEVDASQPPAAAQPMQAQMDAVSENQAFFHQDDLASDPSLAAQSPAPDSPAPTADLPPPEPTAHLDGAEPEPELQASDEAEDPAVDTLPQAAETAVDSPLASTEPAIAEDPVAEVETSRAEPEQIMMDLGAPEADAASEPLVAPSPEDLPDTNAAFQENPVSHAGEPEAAQDLAPPAEPVAADSSALMDADLSPEPAPEEAAELTSEPVQVDPSPVSVNEPLSPEAAPADDGLAVAEPGVEADADLAWQSAMDADASAAPQPEPAVSAEPTTPEAAVDDQGTCTAEITPAPEKATLAETSDHADTSDPALIDDGSAPAGKPRIIAVADEDLAAQVNLRPGLLTLLSHTTEIPPQSRAEVAGCAAQLRAWLEAH